MNDLELASYIGRLSDSDEPRFVVEHRYTTGVEPQIHYVRTRPTAPAPEESDSSAIMLVHGFPQSWRAWRGVARLLAGDHTLLMPDLRGFGDSARPLSGYGTTVAEDDLIAVLDHADVERVTLVGHDLGAVVSYFFAASHPERVERLVFIEAAVLTSDRSKWPTFWHWPFLTRPDLAEAMITGNERTFLRALIHDYAQRPATLDEDIEHYARHLTAPGGLRAALAWFREGLATDEKWLSTHSPEKLRMPVLALGGALWGDKPLEMLQEVAHDVRGGTVPGVGHWIAEEDPEALVTRLRDFIEETPATGVAVKAGKRQHSSA